MGAKQLFESEMKNYVMEINASDERGIFMVREIIKQFASSPVKKNKQNFDYPSFKFLILDESDSMTSVAQHALRSILEAYSKHTRFCFTCNFISYIIEPIKSRCVKFRFNSLNDNVVRARILEICYKEDIKLNDNVVEILSKISNGDLRKTITLLQSSVRIQGNDVTTKTLIELAGIIPDTLISNIWIACESGKFDSINKIIKSVIAEGYRLKQILLRLLDWMLTKNDLEELQLAKISYHLALADKAQNEGSDEYIQLIHVSMTISRVLNNKTLEDS